MSALLMLLLLFLAIFLIVLVLIQRGKGGGLAGALGGMGGQSAFGTKAGDLFTKITIGVSAFWILVCIASVGLLGRTSSRFGEGTFANPAESAPASTDDAAGSPDRPSEQDSQDSGSSK
ncbi:MAG: preprotein translocase subunit SecG [Thermoguttaceae bacterium]|nr:preprotein translocase subunit SecG [Thermoguttaceae bacterium]